MLIPKKSQEYWTPKHLEYLKAFREKGNEESYYLSHESDGQEYWYEIPELLKEMQSFSDLLQKVSLPFRRRILLNIAATDMSRRVLERNYGITRPRVQNFINNKYEKYEIELISSLAILCRVPISWLISEEISEQWEVEHFRYQRAVSNGADVLSELLNSSLEHTVKGIYLRDKGIELFIRIEKVNRECSLEVFNDHLNGIQMKYIDEILHPVTYKMKYFQTVVRSQVNPVFQIVQ